ncbi:MAG: RNA-binding S4 domain-containing protein [Hyphomicrobiaceae bacterium]|nr:RNA-binding S4 domain-containing protein [Hyphomicrobiaceae bacterium]
MSRGARSGPISGGAQRLDKWLWFARVVKTRTLAAALVLDGKVRVNRVRIDRPSHAVRPGDVITVAAHSRVRILKVVATGERRGPAAVAETLYGDLTPPVSNPGAPGAGEGNPAPGAPRRDAGSGRPTKRERRALERLTEDDC